MLARRPAHTLTYEARHLRRCELLGLVSDRDVEHPSLAELLDVRGRHCDAVEPRQMLASERRRCQHVDGWVDEHVVLLGRDPEIVDALGDWMLAVDDLDLVGHAHALAARVFDEGRADDEVVWQARAKRRG